MSHGPRASNTAGSSHVRLLCRWARWHRYVLSFCFGRSAVSVSPGSHPCTVAILVQGTSWVVAVAQAFLCAVLVICSVVWSGVVCDWVPWSPAGGAGVCSAIRFFVSARICVFMFARVCVCGRVCACAHPGARAHAPSMQYGSCCDTHVIEYPRRVSNPHLPLTSGSPTTAFANNSDGGALAIRPRRQFADTCCTQHFRYSLAG